MFPLQLLSSFCPLAFSVFLVCVKPLVRLLSCLLACLYLLSGAGFFHGDGNYLVSLSL